MQATTRRLLITAGLVTGLTLTTACGGSSSPSATVTPSTTAAAFPVTIQTTNGDVVIPKRPTAIVSLSPTATEDLYVIYEPLAPVRLLQDLKEPGIGWIAIDHDSYQAMGCNILTIRPGVVVMVASKKIESSVSDHLSVEFRSMWPSIFM